MDINFVRQAYRSLIPERSRERFAWARRYAGRQEFERALRVGGRAFAMRQLAALVLRWPRRVAVTVSGVRLRVRPGTSDIRTLEQIFVQRQYAVPVSPAPRTILDAGANLGASALFFAARWPDAEIAALEPEPSNFALLQTNTSRTPMIRPVFGALWSLDAPLHITNPGSEKWSFRLAAGHSGAGAEIVPGFSIPTLLDRLHWNRLDLLKIDIEGAERDVFASNPDWLARVDTLMIEIHDAISPGAMAAVQHATRQAGMTGSQSGETWCFTRR
jgi:FkbM family methyltransferase